MRTALDVFERQPDDIVHEDMNGEGKNTEYDTRSRFSLFNIR